MTTTLTYPEGLPERGRGVRVDGGSRLLHLSYYRAALAGVQVIEEDLRHTSQQCSHCGQRDRKSGSPLAYREGNSQTL